MGVVVEVWLDVCVWRKKCMAVSMQEIVQVSVWRAVQVSVLGVVSSLEIVCFGGSTLYSFYNQFSTFLQHSSISIQPYH